LIGKPVDIKGGAAAFFVLVARFFIRNNPDARSLYCK